MGDGVEQQRPDPLAFREILADAVRYWEQRRWVYNGALTMVVLICFAVLWPFAWRGLTFQTVLWLFINAVLANIAYCAAYLVDVILQLSSLRQAWRKRRWYLLVIGTLFACAITYLVAVGLFSP
jgi:hypothetical protein